MVLNVFWAKTKIQVFGNILDETIQSVHACSEVIEILKKFTYLGNLVHNDGGSSQEVTWWIGLANSVFGVVNTSTEGRRFGSFKSLVTPVLLYSCEEWTLNTDVKRRTDIFGTRCFDRTMGYLWFDFVTNQRLFCETDSRHITSIVC